MPVKSLRQEEAVERASVLSVTSYDALEQAIQRARLDRNRAVDTVLFGHPEPFDHLRIVR